MTTSPSNDAVRQHLIDNLNPHRDAFPSHIIETMSSNIAFLIKYTCGPAIQASQVSVSVINVRGLDNNEIGDKATICVHEGPGKFTVVISKQVESGQNAVIGLREKVNKAIEDILANEGNKGYGDI